VSAAKKPIVVALWDVDLASPGIIIAAPTGVEYVNQVNGVACEERSLEGFYVPLSKTDAQVFDPGWWETHENRRSSVARMADEERARWRERAVELEAAVAAIRPSVIARLEVVESDDNVEAWVRVKVDLTEGEGGSLDGVLTWQNCD
jgi:uncharacterized protein DUF6210